MNHAELLECLKNSYGNFCERSEAIQICRKPIAPGLLRRFASRKDRVKQRAISVLFLACLSGAALTGCDGNMAVNYAPVAACGDVDLDPNLCAR